MADSECRIFALWFKKNHGQCAAPINFNNLNVMIRIQDFQRICKTGLADGLRYDYIAEATLADAIMDRLVNSSNLIK